MLYYFIRYRIYYILKYQTNLTRFKANIKLKIIIHNRNVININHIFIFLVFMKTNGYFYYIFTNINDKFTLLSDIRLAIAS